MSHISHGNDFSVFMCIWRRKSLPAASYVNKLNWQASEIIQFNVSFVTFLFCLVLLSLFSTFFSLTSISWMQITDYACMCVPCILGFEFDFTDNTITIWFHSIDAILFTATDLYYTIDVLWLIATLAFAKDLYGLRLRLCTCDRRIIIIIKRMCRHCNFSFDL